MSKFSKQQFECPHCKHQGEFTMYESVNVTLDPSLREKVFSGELFKWTCPSCDKEVTILYNMLYHDMTNKFMIMFAPSGIEAINEQYNDLLKRYPGMRNSLYRSVDNLNDLKEKILILENELNDIAIELAKVLVKYDKNEKLPAGSKLLFERVIKNKDDVSKDSLILRVLLNDVPQKSMVVIGREQYDRYLSFVQENDSLQMENYCDTINEQWILSRIVH